MGMFLTGLEIFLIKKLYYWWIIHCVTLFSHNFLIYFGEHFSKSISVNPVFLGNETFQSFTKFLVYLLNLLKPKKFSLHSILKFQIYT